MHGVHLGFGYKSNLARSVFVEYIAQDFRMQLGEAKFFSLQADGSTDVGKLKMRSCILTRMLMELFMYPTSSLQCDILEELMHMVFVLQELPSMCLGLALFGRIGFGCGGPMPWRSVF